MKTYNFYHLGEIVKVRFHHIEDQIYPYVLVVEVVAESDNFKVGALLQLHPGELTDMRMDLLEEEVS